MHMTTRVSVKNQEVHTEERKFNQIYTLQDTHPRMHTDQITLAKPIQNTSVHAFMVRKSLEFPL